MSKNFCVLLWNHLSLDSNGNVRPCCNYKNHPKDGRETPDVLAQDFGPGLALNNQHHKDLRKLVMEGGEPEGCSRCFDLERNGDFSSRKIFNKEYNVDEQKIKEYYQNTLSDGTLIKTNVEYLDITFGNKCNLACRMCSPFNSNQWFDEYLAVAINKGSDSVISTSKMLEPLRNLVWFEDEAFKEAMLKTISTVKYINFVGGEPFLVESHLDLLERAADLGLSKNVNLSYNSNISRLPTKLVKIWSKYQAINLMISCDGYGDIFEYVRYPLKWSKFERNLKEIVSYKDKGVNYGSLQVNFVFQNINAHYITDYLDFALYRAPEGLVRIPYFNVLTSPIWYDVIYLPKEQKEIITNKILSYLEEHKERIDEICDPQCDIWGANKRNLASLHANINRMNSVTMSDEENEISWREFWRVTKILDKTRGQDTKMVLSDLKIPDKRDIVYATVNYVSKKPEDYQQRIRDITNFFNPPLKKGLVCIDVLNVNEALQQAAQLNASWLVVNALGHYTYDKEWFYRAIRECEEKNIPLMAHILDRKENYYWFHEQSFVINVDAWRNVGQPKYDNYHTEDLDKTFETVSIERSVENFHDDYTPYWIKPGSERKTFSVDYLGNGYAIIRAFMENGYKVENFSNEYRNKKTHLYPEQDHTSFGRFLLQDHDHVPCNPIHAQYAERIRQESKSVSNKYYVLNTEPLIDDVVGEPIDHLITVSAGIKPALILARNGYRKNTHVTFVDFSQSALDFQAFLMQNWDGDFKTYENICGDFANTVQHLGIYPCKPMYISFFDALMLFAGENNVDPEEFKGVWQAFKALPKSYIHMNLHVYSDQIKLAEHIKTVNSNVNYMWISNAFWMDYSVALYGKEELKSRRDSLLDVLRKSNREMYVEESHPWAYGLKKI